MSIDSGQEELPRQVAGRPEMRESDLEYGRRTKEIIDNVLRDQFGDFFRSQEVLDGREAIPCIYKEGDPDSRVVLVLGDNASGKSYFRRLVEYTVQIGRLTELARIPDGKYPSDIFEVSPEERMEPGSFAALRYGDEAMHSTGDSSLQMVSRTIGWIRDAAQKKPTRDCIAYFDEPDMGSGLRVAKSIGLLIGSLGAERIPQLKSIFVTSHNPAVVRQLLKADSRPHYVFLGDSEGPRTIEDWLEMQKSEEVDPISPEELKKLSRQRFSDIQKVLDLRKERRKKTK
ncbi:hypothetical protein A2480_04295 [Candidatus Uhrbacteria bacterium RIFOXYC2_FULL_47_19]|uniref:ATPase AAA-type core domain-containing protein n=1 Tax=Candidatus Uhrbacteria bacterium RIFOXYC2_FULL_47_19 TaxID=1802424 RepID=A0A1F7WC89_9BACT|nr:MAG: hypothetical protein A2480_04295 [Candidatus Uhrbacteria bacterium RIFOXYC2_FULL_47_19]HCC22323.1 hypothetical protein [Candidatus Uhrbacteria bacterium]